MKSFVGATRLVGSYPIVTGFWRTFSFALGLLGIMFMIVSVFVYKVNFNNDLILILISMLAALMILPIYLPEKKVGDSEELKSDCSEADRKTPPARLNQEKVDVTANAHGWKQPKPDARGYGHGDQGGKKSDGKWGSNHPDAHGWRSSSHK